MIGRERELSGLVPFSWCQTFSFWAEPSPGLPTSELPNLPLYAESSIRTQEEVRKCFCGWRHHLLNTVTGRWWTSNFKDGQLAPRTDVETPRDTYFHWCPHRGARLPPVRNCHNQKPVLHVKLAPADIYHAVLLAHHCDPMT